jgi:hypothetical protein
VSIRTSKVIIAILLGLLIGIIVKEKVVLEKNSAENSFTITKRVEKISDEGNKELAAKKTEENYSRPTASSIKSGFEKAGFNFSEPEKLKTRWLHHGEFKSSGVTFVCEIYSRTEEDIDWIEFTIDGSSYVDLNTPDAPPNPDVTKALTSVSKEFFPNCTVVLFDKTEREKAKKWLQVNASRAIGQGKVFNATFDKTNFQLYGMPYIRILEIKFK